MMIKPKPRIFKCPACDWEIGVAPLSDCLMPWEFFHQCPECATEPLMIMPLGSIKEKYWRLIGKMSEPKY